MSDGEAMRFAGLTASEARVAADVLDFLLQKDNGFENPRTQTLQEAPTLGDACAAYDVPLRRWHQWCVRSPELKAAYDTTLELAGDLDGDRAVRVLEEVTDPRWVNLAVAQSAAYWKRAEIRHRKRFGKQVQVQHTLTLADALKQAAAARAALPAPATPALPPGAVEVHAP